MQDREGEIWKGEIEGVDKRVEQKDVSECMGEKETEGYSEQGDT